MATRHCCLWSSVCRCDEVKSHDRHTTPHPAYCHGIGCLVVFAVVAGNYLITHATLDPSTTYELFPLHK